MLQFAIYCMAHSNDHGLKMLLCAVQSKSSAHILISCAYWSKTKAYLLIVHRLMEFGDAFYGGTCIDV